MDKKRLLELAGLCENINSKAWLDSILNEVEHKADLQGMPREYYSRDPESAWFSGVSWAIEETRNILDEKHG